MADPTPTALAIERLTWLKAAEMAASLDLSEDEVELVASAYHDACEAHRERKRALWQGREMPKGALGVAPDAWVTAVAHVISQIVASRCRAMAEEG